MTNPQQPSPQPAQPQNQYAQAPQQAFGAPQAPAAAPMQFSARQKLVGAVTLTMVLAFAFRYLTWFKFDDGAEQEASVTGNGSVEIKDLGEDIFMSVDLSMLGLYSGIAVLALLIALVCGALVESFRKYSEVLAVTAITFYVAVPTVLWLILNIYGKKDDFYPKAGAGLIIAWIFFVLGMAVYLWFKFGQNLGASSSTPAASNQWAPAGNQPVSPQGSNPWGEQAEAPAANQWGVPGHPEPAAPANPEPAPQGNSVPFSSPEGQHATPQTEEINPWAQGSNGEQGEQGKNNNPWV